MAVALKCRDYRPGFIADVYNGLDPDAYQPPISKWLEAVQNQKKADFKLVSLTRLIYMNRPGLEQLQSIVMDTMRCCSFWPSNIPHRNRIRKSEFWSENHSFLYLSSAYLYRQQALKLGKDSGFVGKREVELLQCYLRGHCTQCPGVYEVLSVTYLPFTMCALLNLFDFSDDEAVRSAADILLNIITRQFLRVADADGSCHLSASCRVPHVEYLYKHSAFFNIHALLYFLELRDEAPNQSIFADFLSLTTWAPNIDVLNEFNMVGFHSEKVNHAFKHVSRVYTFDTLSPVEATPFYWSAGLIFDSDYIERSRTYKEMYNVCTESLSHFERLSRDFDIRVSKLFRGLCSGQRYCGVTLSVFKSPTRRAVLSCFENFNAGRLLLQQVPWCANVAGLGLWTFGNLKKKPLMYPKVYVSKPYAPYVTQKDNIVMIVYNMPKQAVVSAFWPNSYFECEYRQQASILSFVNVKDIEDSKKHKYHCNLWWIGTYRDCYVGLFCSEVSRRKDSFFNSEFISNEEPRLCSRRVFTGMKVVWVCVVGDTEMYPTIEKFFEYCRNLDIRASKHGNSCTGEVKLAGSTLLSAQLKSENIF